MRKFTLVFAGMLFFAFTAGAFALNVGYVDIEKVFNQYQGTKTAKEKLQKEVEKEQKNIEKEKNDLIKLKKDLDNKKLVLDKDKVAAQEKELQDKLTSLQEKAMKIQQDLLNQEKELTANIVDEIRSIVQKLAKEKNYDMVFEKSMLLYGG
ncbi:MAG: OmpH family outer membrane protein, partial [Spirochaetia bacterium]|nr:OmpH family outer membrane protein [Spirochaetia bacterium]